MDKVKIQNKTNHDVGIMFTNGIGKNITPNMVLEIPYSEFEYLATGSRLFSDKHLTVLTDEVLDKVGLDAEALKFETDEEVIAKLTKSKMPEFVAYLNGVTEQHNQFRIIDLIKKRGLMEKLAAAKINKLNSIFNVDLNIDLTENETNE